MTTTISGTLRKSAGVGVMVAALAVGVVAGAAFADKEYGRGEHSEGRERSTWHSPERLGKKLSQRLSLSKAQQKQLESLLQQSHKTRQQMQDGMRKQVRDIVTQKVMNRKDALKLLNLRRDMRVAMRGNMAESLTTLHAMLTPKQRAEMAEIAPKMLRRLHAARGERGERRGKREGKRHDNDGKRDEHGKREGKGHDKDRGHSENHDSEESRDNDSQHLRDTDSGDSHENGDSDGDSHKYGDSDR